MAVTNIAKRNNEGKPQISYILDNPEAVCGLARHFELGTKKYGKDNYKKGLTQVGVMNCLLRHLLAFNSKEDVGVDSETGETFNTVDAILWNALVLSQQWYTRPDMDDRSAVVVANNG